MAAVLLIIGVMVSGCDKEADAKSKAATPNAQEASGNPITAPVDYLGAVGAAQKQAVKTVDLTTFSQAVQAFQAGEDRLPASLSELVTEGYLPRLPDAPKGMRFEYNPSSGQVRLVAAPAPPVRP